MSDLLIPIRAPERCYCDMMSFEPAQFNLKMRAYQEPDFGSAQPYRYYLFDYFFTIYFQGPLFWRGMVNRHGSDAEMGTVAPFALERKGEMQEKGMFHYPRLYHFTTESGPVNIVAGMLRVYVFDSPSPVSFIDIDGDWFAKWPIIFEEGLPEGKQL